MAAVLLPLPRQQWQLGNPCTFSTLSHNPKVPFRLRCSHTTSARKWDSNAETVRTQRFSINSQFGNDGDEDDQEDEKGPGNWRKKRRWWSDEWWDMNEPSSGGIWEDVIDSVWIFKVFRSYGWMLPVVIISFLLSTGPKAFLMALALPLGQSALSLAFEKLWGRAHRRPKRKAKTRRKPFVSSAASDIEFEKEEQDENQDTKKETKSYQSWAAGIDGSVNKSGQNAPSFGGWDELDKARSMHRRPRRTGGARKSAEQGKLSKKERRSDTPLLVRLLIAVFPFLGSWTKML